MSDRRETFRTTGMAIGAMGLLFLAAALWVYGVVVPAAGESVAPMAALSMLAVVGAIGLLALAARQAFR